MFGNTLLLCAGKKFDPWLDKIGQVQTTPSGHQIWYLQDCVCFKYNDGSGVKTLGVAFAEKRAAGLKWQNANTDIAAMFNYNNEKLYNHFYLDDGMTDTQLNAVGFNDRATAKSNTANMIAAGSPAADHAYSVIVQGAHCALPNVQQMKRVFSLRKEIDARDPTVARYPSLALSNWVFTNSRAWTSTECNDMRAYFMRSDGECNWRSLYKANNNFGVIPVLEM